MLARVMQPIRICPICEERLEDAIAAMRHHAARMSTAVILSRTNPSEEQRRELKAELEKTFNDAQMAWDAYRAHLTEHGILPSHPM